MLQTAIVAKRTDEGTPDTEEIRGLAEAAGARVVGEVTQTRPADPGLEFGAGKVEELADLVAETGADTVVVDGELTPQQSVNLTDATGATVVDRHRVVLEIFAQRARPRRAQLQVELARLKYRLPRLREASDEGLMNRWTESGTQLYDVRDRIDALERKLDDLPAVDEHQRERRREEGFDLVAIAGYTNAGKSTLLRRLADEMALEDDRHPDLGETVGVEDRLFETLETTTRRATVVGRDVLLTDTVGFLDDLPHWLVESFRGTLREVREADAVLLVVDADQSVPEMRRKLETSRETIPGEVPVVTALNKVDRLDERKLARKREALGDLVDDPVPVSALEGDLDELRRRIDGALPDLRRERLRLPLTDDAMSLVSWIHDRAVHADVEYGTEDATVDFTARPATVRKARAKAEEVHGG
ncbi:GTPase HflX [Halobacteriales archaeon QS_1_68_20]|nr:MAG: GTPase HflX [Halobacteriales archaeon QS_1_68_20]